MILTGSAIRDAVASGAATIDPFAPEFLNPNSYNFHLGSSLLIPQSAKGPARSVTIPTNGFLLEPGKLYLGCTCEIIGSKEFVTILSGRSSMGRLGLFLNISADLGHIGAILKWTLELLVVQPLIVYAGMRVGQVSFWEATEPSFVYSGRYQGADMPELNKDDSL